jgi:hypothetical protein
VQPEQHELYWNPQAVSKLMEKAGIKDRADLAQQKIGVGQTTVYRTFDEGWGGRVRIKMLSALALWTGIALAELVATLVFEPGQGQPFVPEGSSDESR